MNFVSLGIFNSDNGLAWNMELINYDLVYRCIYASLILNELSEIVELILCINWLYVVS